MIKISNNVLIDTLVALLISSFTILASFSSGVFIMMGLLLLIIMINISQHGFYIHNELYLKYMVSIIGYTYITSIWAFVPSDTYDMGGSLINITLCMVILYDAYYRVNLNRLLRAIMWGGYLVVIYTFLYYGFSYVMLILSIGERIESEFANINSVAMAATISLIINCYFGLYKKWDISIIFSLPSLLIVFGSGTRKALVTIIVGLFILLIMKQFLMGKNIFRLVSRIIMTLLAMTLVLIVASQLDITQGILGRMEGLIASFTGEGVVDTSSRIRSELREIGFSTMLDYPFGIGIGCPHILALQKTGEDYYLHCNYAEIAAGGGFVGLVIFYSIYVYFYKLSFYIRKDSIAIILLTLVVVMLLKDYGAVTYFYKDNYMLFLVICLYLSQKSRGYVYGIDKKLK